MMACDRCDHLTERLKEKEKALQELAKFINALGDEIESTAHQAAAELSAGDVPQRRYEYLLATLETCNGILDRLNRPAVAMRQKGAGLFAGLFGSIKW